MIQIQSEYTLLAYVLLPMVTLYCGIYLNLSNHYVFRPKLLPFFERLSISSSLAIQVLMDIVSNLSFITYSCSSFLSSPTTDSPFRLVSIYSIYWLTIFMSIIMYIKIGNDQSMSTIILCKNGIILVLGFGNLVYHYIGKVYYITLPSILILLYLVNVVITVYEDKFVYFVLELLDIKQTIMPKQKIKMISHLPTIEELSKNYPISAVEISDKMDSLQKSKSSKQAKPNAKVNNKAQKNTKIDTKILAREKLMKICVCVHLSMAKRQEDEMNTVRHYYALMNGTLNSDNPNIRKVRTKTNKNKTNFLTNRNKDKLVATRRSILKTQPQQPIPQPQPQPHQSTQARFHIPLPEQPVPAPQPLKHSPIQQQSILFYIFPIRIVQSSKIVSIVYSIIINLGYGILLSYCQSVMNTLKYGRFAQFVLAALLLPNLPRIGTFQFLNTLTLATVWKLSVCGLFALLSMLLSIVLVIVDNSDDDITTPNWQNTGLMEYLFIIVIVLVVLAFGLVLANKYMWKFMAFLFLASTVAAAYLVYAGIQM